MPVKPLGVFVCRFARVNIRFLPVDQAKTEDLNGL
ncbi:hypothetical protein [Curvibacter phage PCA1]|nr:hypothetical protein [Curvibacter phage PCA1]